MTAHQATAWTPLPDALARLRTLVSPQTGIVRRVHDLLRAPDDARLFRLGSDGADSPFLLGAELGDARSSSGGFAETRERALAAALGEAAERYTACYLPQHDLVLARARDLAGSVGPARFALFHERQYAQTGFPFRPFTDDSTVRWTRGRSLHDDTEAWLPAQLVYLGWRERLDDETRIGYSTSNGLACGATWDEAVATALLEVLERDAFMLTWYCRLSLPRLDWGDDAASTAYEERYLAPTALTWSAVDLSCFWGVPTVLGVVHARGDGALGVGAGSAATVTDALRKAAAEAFAVRSWAREQARENGRREFAPDFSDVTSFADHVEFYADAERARHAAFLDASPVRRPVGEVRALPSTTPRELLDALLCALAAEELEAYAVDVTSPDVRAAGLHVAKVLVPELCQLDVAHRARYLGGPRLYTAAHRLGLVPAPLTVDDLNPYPHPFP